MGYYTPSEVKITAPCRICGSKKIIVGWYAKRGEHWIKDIVEAWVYCSNCNCETLNYSGVYADDTAINAWNSLDTFITTDNLNKWKRKNEIRKLKNENRKLKKLLKQYTNK